MSKGWYPHAISFGGGGARIVGSMGVLSHLTDAGITDNVTDWYGCSAGSFCAMGGAIGGTGTWIKEVAKVYDSRTAGIISDDLLCNFINVWGVSAPANIAEFVGKIIDTWEPGCSAWTFADLSQNRPGIRLHISATNITRGKLEIFNAVNTPDIRIIDAISASAAMPLYFVPWVHPITGDIYCDGGILETYPWLCIPNKAETLVVVCSDTDIIGRPVPVQPITTIVEYISRLVSIIYRDSGVVPLYWIAVNVKDIHFIDFNVSKEEQCVGFEQGIRSAKGWLAFRASMQDSPGGTAGYRRQFADQNTSCADHPCPDRRSDSHQSGNRMPSPCLPLDLHNEKRRTARRWSL